MDEAIVSHAQKRRLAEIITAIMTSRFDNATAADRQRCNRKLSLWIASLAIVVLLALPATPLSAMTLADARHFAQRIGFAATPDEVMRLLPMTRDQAIADILERTRVQPVTAAPTWAGGTIDLRVPKGTPEQRREFLRQQRLETLELRAWWYREMLTTPSPLTERMTLFWHNHFATSVRKVRSAALMYRQNQLLRSHAVGSFRSLLAAIPRDPAMILWLDGVANRRDRPNENFARELLELFALGEGKIYTEQDIKEAARAFTGWSIDRANGEFRFRRLAHDDGAKKFLGKRGPFNGDDIIDVLLDHPRTAEYIVEKLWREFVSETPDPIEVRRIAARFKARNYDIKTALGELFGVPAFWAPESRGRLVRSPVELVVGTMRLFGIKPFDGQTVFNIGTALGQDVFAPPNVKGWPGGNAWIASNTLIARQQLLNRLTRPQIALAETDDVRRGDARGGDISRDDTGRDQGEMRPPPATPPGRQMRPMRDLAGGNIEAWIESLPAQLRSAEAVTMLLLPTAPVHKPDDMADPARFVRALVNDPTYQLK